VPVLATKMSAWTTALLGVQRGATDAERIDLLLVALARRESPHKGQQHLDMAKILTTELPHTLAALRCGRITEWRATILVRETACLSREDLGDRQQAELSHHVWGGADRDPALGLGLAPSLDHGLRVELVRQLAGGRNELALPVGVRHPRPTRGRRSA